MRKTEYAVKKAKSFVNKLLLVFFYIAIVFGIGFGCYYLYLTNYDFYFEDNMIEVELGEIKKSNIITVKPFDVKDGDYIYTIKKDNKNVATVDSKGNVRGISVGIAVLEVRYKNSLFPKKQKIVVVPHNSEQQIDETDNSQEIILP